MGRGVRIGVGIVSVIFVFVIVAIAFRPAVSFTVAAPRTRSKNNMKQIGLAIHNYHDIYESFPVTVFDPKTNTPHNSWMTGLLPYIEQGSIYSSIDTNLPWTAPANRTAYSSVIQSYLDPGQTDESTHQVKGLGAAHYAGSELVFRKNKVVRNRDVTDGLSNTIFAGSVAAGFKAWGDPTNVRDPGQKFGKSATQFGSPYRGGTIFLFGDGSVRFVSENIDPGDLKVLATPDADDMAF